MTPRVTADSAAMMLGVPLRTVQQMAAAGDLPGAVKVGKRWTFDPQALTDWLRDNETWRARGHRPRATHTGVVARYGRNTPLPVSPSAQAYELAIRSLRKGGLQSLSNAKKPPAILAKSS